MRYQYLSRKYYLWHNRNIDTGTDVKTDDIIKGKPDWNVMGSDVARLTLCVFSPTGHQVHVSINSSRLLICVIAGHLVVLIMQNSTIAALVLYRLYFFVRMAAVILHDLTSSVSF